MTNMTGTENTGGGKRYDVITALDLCVDLLVDLGGAVPAFGQQERLVAGYDLEIGGSATIYASQAAKLGLRTAGIGRVGTDIFGRFLLERLRDAGMDTSLIQSRSDVTTGLGIALIKPDHDRAILTCAGSIDAVEAEDFPPSLARDARHIHIGSYFLTNRLQPHYPALLRAAREAGATVSLDTNDDPSGRWDDGILDLLPMVDLFFPNEAEARRITCAASLEEAVERLTRLVPTVVVKRGADGATAYSGGKIHRQAAFPVEVADTVGAGDSFDAGYTCGFLRGMSPADCLRLACLTGSLSTRRPGGVRGQAGLEEIMT